MKTTPTNDENLLGLDSVVASGLPVPVPTDADELYTVPAVFNRRPTNAEIAGITSAMTAERLAAAGYAGVKLTIEDRRLLIAKTSLRQLDDGLAEEIATRIFEVSRAATADQLERDETARRDAEHREEQAREDARLASLINFTPRRDLASDAS